MFRKHVISQAVVLTQKIGDNYSTPLTKFIKIKLRYNNKSKPTDEF